MKWLLERGADPELRGAYGSAREYAVRSGSAEKRCAFEGILEARS